MSGIVYHKKSFLVLPRTAWEQLCGLITAVGAHALQARTSNLSHYMCCKSWAVSTLPATPPSRWAEPGWAGAGSSPPPCHWWMLYRSKCALAVSRLWWAAICSCRPKCCIPIACAESCLKRRKSLELKLN